MTKEDIEVGKVYTCHDDALYKVIEIGKDCIAFITYSFSHNVATVNIGKLDEFILDGMEEDTDPYYVELFDKLHYGDWNYLEI